MKKIILFALILCVSVSALCAANNIWTFTATPYAVQIYSSSLGTNRTSNSGFGFKVGYRHHVGVLLLGADASYHLFEYKVNGNTVRLGSLQMLAKIGGKVSFDRLDLNADIGAGANVGISRLSTTYNLIAGANASASFAVSQNVALTGGVDAYFEWTKAEDSEFRSVQWSVVPAFGIEVEL